MANQPTENDPNGAMVYAVRAIERIEERVAALAERVEQHLTHKRKTPTKAVREAHIRASAAMGGECIFCDAPMFTAEGEFIGVIHHHDKASDACVEAVCACCSGCNARFNSEPTPRAIVDAYHARRVRLEQPLLQLMRRAAHSATGTPSSRRGR